MLYTLAGVLVFWPTFALFFIVGKVGWGLFAGFAMLAFVWWAMNALDL